MVRALLAQGRLVRVVDSAVFTLPTYMVYPLDRHEPTLLQALEGLRLLAQEEREQAGS